MGATGAGIQGATGQGTVGPQGQTGLPGNAGVTGLSGAASSQGNTGLPGATGANGLNGSQGNQGQTGLPGQTGLQGTAGSNGSPGSQGSQGQTGLTITGPRGETGLAGSAGSQGQTGIGSTGPRGFTGLQGPTGFGVGVHYINDTGAHRGITGSHANYVVLFDAAGLPVVDSGVSITTGSTGTPTFNLDYQIFTPTGLQDGDLWLQRGLTGGIGATGPIVMRFYNSRDNRIDTFYPGVTGGSSGNGSNGATGPIGATGAGLQGSTGLPGPQGITGPGSGAQGATGLGGAIGATGVTVGATGTLNYTLGNTWGGQSLTGLQGSINLPFNVRFNRWTLEVPSAFGYPGTTGTCLVDVFKSSYANLSIGHTGLIHSGATGPTLLSTGMKNQAPTTNWAGPTGGAGDVLTFAMKQSASVNQVNLSLDFSKF
jgi:collagen type VII alpha